MEKWICTMQSYKSIKSFEDINSVIILVGPGFVTLSSSIEDLFSIQFHVTFPAKDDSEAHKYNLTVITNHVILLQLPVRIQDM